MIGQYNIDENFYALSQYSRNAVAPRFANKVKAIFERKKISTDSQVLSDGNRNFAQIQNGKVIFIPKSDKALKSKAAAKSVTLVGDLADHYTDTERHVAVIYSGILGYDELNIYDNFFEMGGDSIMLSQMHDLLEEAYPDAVRVADLFEYVTIRSLSEFIDQKRGKQTEPDNQPSLLNDEEETDSICDMSAPQERIYYDYRLSHNRLIYNNPFLDDVTGIPEEKILPILQEIVRRHPILRTYFDGVNDRLVQCVQPDIPITIDHVEVDSLEQIDYRDYLTVFSLNTPPLFHFVLLHSPDKSILLFDVHHILLDGYSSSLAPGRNAGVSDQ